MALRQALWPFDRGTLVEAMEHAIMACLSKDRGGATAKTLHDATNVFRPGSGGMETFNRALKALLVARRVAVIAKTRKGTDVYALVNA